MQVVEKLVKEVYLNLTINFYFNNRFHLEKFQVLWMEGYLVKFNNRIIFTYKIDTTPSINFTNHFLLKVRLYIKQSGSFAESEIPIYFRKYRDR